MSTKSLFTILLGGSLTFVSSACGDDDGGQGSDTDTDTEDEDEDDDSVTGDDTDDGDGTEDGSGSDSGSADDQDSGSGSEDDEDSDSGSEDDEDSDSGSDSGGDDWPDDMYEECSSNADCESGICFISSITGGSFCSATCEEGGTPCPPGDSGTATPSCETSQTQGQICALLCGEGELETQGSCPNTMCCEDVNQPACTHPVGTCGGGDSTDSGTDDSGGSTDDSGDSTDSGSDSGSDSSGTDDSGSSDSGDTDTDTDTDTTTIAG